MSYFSKFAVIRNPSSYKVINNFWKLCQSHNFGTTRPCLRISDKRVYLSEQEEEQRIKAGSMRNYLFAVFIMLCGAGFAAVPLFNTYCQVTGSNGVLNIDLSRERTKNLKRVPNRELTIEFNADRSAYLQWNFQPLQTEVIVAPGETVLAFYSAENPTDKPVSGISTYNVAPYEAAAYFNKIQCFCFDEQLLNPHEQVDMPVFFYIDPDITKDQYLYNVDKIVLSYTFFEAVEGLDLPFAEKFVTREK